MRVLCADDLGQITSNFRMNLVNEPLFVGRVMWPEANLLCRLIILMRRKRNGNFNSDSLTLIFQYLLCRWPVLFLWVHRRKFILYGLIKQAWGSVTKAYYFVRRAGLSDKLMLIGSNLLHFLLYCCWIHLRNGYVNPGEERNLSSKRITVLETTFLFQVAEINTDV